MILLDRYLAKSFGRNLLLTTTVLVSIYMLVDFFDRIDEFINAGKSMGLAAQYFFLKIPFMLDQLLPVCLMLADVVSLGVLSHSGELPALKAAGISVRRLTAPLLLAALVFSLLSLAASQWLLPRTNTTTNRILYQQVRGEIPKGTFRDGRFYYRGANGFYCFARPEAGQDRFTDFQYATWSDSHELQSLLTAGEARWTEDGWQLTDCRIKERTAGGDYQTVIHETLSLTLPESPRDFFPSRYRFREMALFDLQHLARTPASADAPEARLQFHSRLSYIFLGLPLLCLGLPVLLTAHRRWGRDLSLAVPIACAIAFAVWAAWAVLQSLARSGAISPLLAAWLVHLGIGTAGLFFLSRHDRSV